MMGEFVGIGDGVGYTIVAVGVKVEGKGVAVGRAAWVRATPVCTSAVLICAGAQAARVTRYPTGERYDKWVWEMAMVFVPPVTPTLGFM